MLILVKPMNGKSRLMMAKVMMPIMAERRTDMRPCVWLGEEIIKRLTEMSVVAPKRKRIQRRGNKPVKES